VLVFPEGLPLRGDCAVSGLAIEPDNFSSNNDKKEQIIMGDAKRRQGTAGVSADKWRAEKQAQNTQCQRPELFQRYALGIFQKHMMIGLKEFDITKPDASWAASESIASLQVIVDRTLSLPSIKELIVDCLGDLKTLCTQEFNGAFDAMVSGNGVVVDMNGAEVIVRTDRQYRFISVSKGIDLKKHKQISKDCLLFLCSKEGKQITEYLLAFFIDYVLIGMLKDEKFRGYAPFGTEDRVCYWASTSLLIEVISIPWAKEFELIQADLNDRLKESW